MVFLKLVHTESQVNQSHLAPTTTLHFDTVHRGEFCQFPIRWIYYYGSNESTGKKTGKTHLCAVLQNLNYHVIFNFASWTIS